MECEKEERKGVYCDLAIAFESDECGESKSICKKPKKLKVMPKAEPQCVPEGKSCEGGKECCDELVCKTGNGKGENCDLAIAFESDECGKSKSNICQKPDESESQRAYSKEGKFQDQRPIDSSKEDEEHKPYRALDTTDQSKGNIGGEGGSSLDKLLDKLRRLK